jgi:hypothetical protein
MRKPKEFSFTTAKDALQSPEPISITDLARELEVSENKVLLLLEEGYLSLLKKSDTPFLCQVGRPAPAAMRWLKQALSPLPLIPVIPVSYAKQLMGVKTTAGMKKLLLEHGIHVYIDLALGSMISIASFHKMFSLVYPWHERVRFDRQMFFNILTGIDLGSGEKFVRPAPFDVTLEEEIVRIAKLPQPQRALRAMDMYLAYKDAKSIAGLLKSINKTLTPTMIRVESIMRKWEQNRDYPPFKPSPSSSSSSSSRSSSAMSVATSKAGRSTKKPPSAAD